MACTAPTRSGTVHTISANRAFPSASIAEYYGGEQWAKIKDLPYDAYVILDATVGKEHSLKGLRVVKAYPDAARNDTALKYAGSFEVLAPSVASRIPPQVEVYVVFYDQGRGGQALVYARQVESIAPTDNLYRQEYMCIYNY